MSKYQLPEGKKLATFKLEEEYWTAFKTLCEESKTSASQALINFVRNCLTDGKLAPIALGLSIATPNYQNQNSLAYPPQPAIDIDALEDRLLGRLEARLGGGEKVAEITAELERVKEENGVLSKELNLERALKDSAITRLMEIESKKNDDLSATADVLKEKVDELAAKESRIRNLEKLLNDKDLKIEEQEKTIEKIISENKKFDELLTLKDEAIATLKSKLNQPKEASPGVFEGLKKIIESWKFQSKNTRDWTKANQLIDELEKLL